MQALQPHSCDREIEIEMTGKIYGAIDLGASSGRVIAGIFGPTGLELTEIARFANGPKDIDGSLYWDFDGLFESVVSGLLQLADFAEAKGLAVESIGIDTWAVDYGLISKQGGILAAPRHYRDERNLLGVSAVHGLVSQEQLYQENGLQFLPFNTVYQLAAEQLQNPELLAQTGKVLLIPDLIAFLLTGVMRAEVTNASTTGLLSANTQTWNKDLCARLGLDIALLPKLIEPGDIYGTLNLPKLNHPALNNAQVVAVATHDTASAIYSIAGLDEESAYLSSGTWSLLGVLLDEPNLTDAASKANFTNELGVDSKIRFLKNLSGLWLIQESLRTWNETGNHLTVAELLDDAKRTQTDARIDVNDPEFAAPGNIPARIQVHVSRNGGIPPQTPGEIARCIFESLADAYATAISELEQVTGRKINKMFVIGGGSQNDLLCQLTADRCGIQIFAGPVEATAIGNLLAQVKDKNLNYQFSRTQFNPTKGN
jgi:rhamnulokinase